MACSALQVHGFPKVMGVLTHLDAFKEPSKLKKAKKALKVGITRGGGGEPLYNGYHDGRGRVG
jgi:hypothetical protein